MSSSAAARDIGEEWGERFTTLALHARFPAEVLVRTGYLGLGLYLAGHVVGCGGVHCVEDDRLVSNDLPSCGWCSRVWDSVRVIWLVLKNLDSLSCCGSGPGRTRGVAYSDGLVHWSGSFASAVGLYRRDGELGSSVCSCVVDDSTDVRPTPLAWGRWRYQSLLGYRWWVVRLVVLGRRLSVQPVPREGS